MNANTETGSGAVDKLLLLTAIALVLGGIVVFYAYPAWSVLLRALIVVGATGAAIAVAMRSQPGQALWRFIVTSRTEVRKMVWPNDRGRAVVRSDHGRVFLGTGLFPVVGHPASDRAGGLSA